MSGFELIENLVGSGFGELVGDPTVLGLILLLYFGGFVMLQGLRSDAKIVIICLASILALSYIPLLGFLLVVIGGFILYLALMRVISR